MKFEELYKKCAAKRDKVKSTGCENEVNEVLEQLISRCFFNHKFGKYTDELPRNFKLYRIQFYSDTIKTFLEEILGIEVENVKLIENDFVYGNTFEITLKESKEK